MTRCPECESDLELDDYELDAGETFNCPECSVELKILTAEPITVALNNIAGGQAVPFNQAMASALLASVPTLLIYIVLGRFFMRGLMAGSLKG